MNLGQFIAMRAEGTLPSFPLIAPPPMVIERTLGEKRAEAVMAFLPGRKLTAWGIAEACGITVEQFYELTRTGLLPKVKMTGHRGKRVYVVVK